jgi:hypothetical protein
MPPNAQNCSWGAGIAQDANKWYRDRLIPEGTASPPKQTRYKFPQI